MSASSHGRRQRFCPKCQGRLFERETSDEHVKVDVCPSCHGMWFDPGELQKQAVAVDGKIVPPAETKVSGRSCPECRVVMTAFKYSGTDVSIDLCEGCRGVWLDAGELARLGERPADEGGFLGFLSKAFHDLTDW